jgi:alpha-1,2-mannosyltransferase
MLRAVRSILSVLAFAVLPVVCIVLTCVAGGRNKLGWDFQTALFPAARSVLHGGDPYVGTTAATLHNGTAYVYPPLAAYLLTPVAALPTLPADVVACLLGALAALLTLLVLRVPDWRCYGVSLLWAPVLYSVHLGTLSTVLALAAAAAWRWRRNSWVGGIAVAAGVSLKLFLWPLLVWLCLLRLWRTAAVAIAGTFVLVLGPWAASGFAGFTRYPSILHASEAVGGPGSYTLTAAVERFGGSSTVGTGVSVLAVLLVASLAFVLARDPAELDARRERDLFALAIGVALLATPILWLHYFALLLAVLPLYLPRLHPIWFAPVVMFAFPITPYAATGWEVIAALAVALAAVGGAAAVARHLAEKPVTP